MRGDPPASPPYAGSFRPSGFLGFFDFEDPNGQWRLEITDTAELDEGVLNGWSLSITTDQPDAFEPFAFTDASGAYTITGITPGTHTILQQPPFAVTAVQLRGNATVERRIERVVAVEQVEIDAADGGVP